MKKKIERFLDFGYASTRKQVSYYQNTCVRVFGGKSLFIFLLLASMIYEIMSKKLQRKSKQKHSF